jgi:hypothetical protein
MKRTWKADAVRFFFISVRAIGLTSCSIYCLQAECQKRGSVHTARAVLSHACGLFPAKKGLWVLAARLEKSVNDSAAMDAILKRAVVHCPRAEILWLMASLFLFVSVRAISLTSCFLYRLRRSVGCAATSRARGTSWRRLSW